MLVRQKTARSINVWFMDGMNAPAQGIAVQAGKKTLVRGVVDVSSDGRADLVLLEKKAFTAYAVDRAGAQNAAGEMVWTTHAIPLTNLASSKRWWFLVLE